MSEQNTNNTSVFSIASIRSSIFAKINAVCPATDSPVKTEETATSCKDADATNSQVSVISEKDKSTEDVCNERNVSSLQNAAEHGITQKDSVSIVASEPQDGSTDDHMDVQLHSTSSSPQNPAEASTTEVLYSEQQTKCSINDCTRADVTSQNGQKINTSVDKDWKLQSSSCQKGEGDCSFQTSLQMNNTDNTVIKTETEDDGYADKSTLHHAMDTDQTQPINCNDKQEDSALIQSQTLNKAFDGSTFNTEMVDTGYPFQTDVTLTSTDFSQLVVESTEDLTAKKEIPEKNAENVDENVSEDVAVTRVEYRTVDSDREQEEESSSESSDVELPEPKNRHSDEDDEFFGKPLKKNRLGFDEIRTHGELFPEELPPIEELTIDIGEDTELQEIGVIDSIVGVLVVIRSTVEHSPVQDDTIFFLEDRKPLGQVFEVMGQVRMPFYSVRFNSPEDIAERDIEIGKKVFFAPTVPEITHYVFVAQLKKQKGSDASWENNNEPPPSHVEYSDDEEERRAKAKRRNKKKNGAGGDDTGSSSEDDDPDADEKKAKRQSRQHNNDRDNRGRGRGRRGRGRGGGRGADPNQHSGRWPPSDWSSKRFGPSAHPPHFDWDQPGNTFPPPPHPGNQNNNGPPPWNSRGRGNGVLQMTRFPPPPFCQQPPHRGVNPWGSPNCPPPHFANPNRPTGAARGPYPFQPPSHGSFGMPEEHHSYSANANGVPQAFQTTPPPPPNTKASMPGSNAPVFNPNVPPPSFNSPFHPPPFPAPPPQSQANAAPPSVHAGFGSQPTFATGSWGPGGQGSQYFVNPSGTSMPATQASGSTSTSGQSTESKPVIMDTRHIQNSGD